MAECFSERGRQQVSEWIVGRKGFDLLYKATRDTCSSAVFHQKCDNKGPTLTIFYNSVNCVFEGYTSASWNSNCVYQNDTKAFLFRLLFKGEFQPKKFPVTTAGSAIYCSASYGPTFGGSNGHDLQAFSGTVNKKRQYYLGNGSTAFGNYYNIQGESSATITASNLQFTDIEVYRVTDDCDEPWRILSEQNIKTLKSEIVAYFPLEGLKVKHVNILLIGPVGAGKSSYFNTINSIFRGHVTSQACSGSAEHSLTTMYRVYKVRSSERRGSLRFLLCDTRGLEEGQGMDSSDFVAIFDGHLPDGYQFNPSIPISSENSDCRKNPTLEDKIHCIAFIIDGCSVDVFPDKILHTIKSIRKKANQRGIPQVILLTKVDKMCPLVEADPSQMLHSATVGKVVDKVSQLMGLPRAHVFPVKNYEKEMELDCAMDVPALVSLRQMLRFADDYLYNFLPHEKNDFLNFCLFLFLLILFGLLLKVTETFFITFEARD